MVLLSEVSNCLDDWESVVSNDFINSTPATDDVFKYPFSNSISIFSSEHMEFRVIGGQY